MSIEISDRKKDCKLFNFSPDKHKADSILGIYEFVTKKTGKHGCIAVANFNINDLFFNANLC